MMYKALHIALTQLLPIMRNRLNKMIVSNCRDIHNVLKEMIIINIFGGGDGIMLGIIDEVRYGITDLLDQLLELEYKDNEKGISTELMKIMMEIKVNINSCNSAIEDILQIYFIPNFDYLDDIIEEWVLTKASSLMVWWHPEDSIMSLKEMWHLEDIFTSLTHRYLSDRMIIVRRKALVFNNGLIPSLIIQVHNNKSSLIYGRGRFC